MKFIVVASLTVDAENEHAVQLLLGEYFAALRKISNKHKPMVTITPVEPMLTMQEDDG